MQQQATVPLQGHAGSVVRVDSQAIVPIHLTTCVGTAE
jgi:hypothetical protein